MSLQSLSKPKTTTTSKGLAGLSKPKAVKADLTTVGGLKQTAEQAGYGAEAAKITDTTPKLSFLQRLGKGLGAFNPAEAILTGAKEGVGKGLVEYGKNILQGVGSAITGTDYEKDRRSFKDVAGELGIENGIAKAGIGFLGDVLLDPTTYFGGALAKGLLKGTKAVAGTALKGVGKVAPDVEAGLKLAGTGLQDALGRAFQYGYKTSKGATSDVMSFLSKQQQAKLGLAASNLNRLGTGVLTKEQAEELALKMIAGKRAEFIAREAGKSADDISAVAREAAKSSDPVVQKAIEAQSLRTKKFAEGITENPYETYFPFIKKDKVDKFVKETAGIRVGSEGYKKQFKNLITNENLELDPAKAFFTREAQIVSDKQTRDFLSGFVKKYGKSLDEFENSDEAAKAGYQLIKEKGIFGKEVGYVPQFDAKLIRDSLDTGFQTVNILARATGFDAVTSLFKRSVTGLFAPFHVRNMVSGNIQNFEALGIGALNPKNIAAGQKIAYLIAKGEKIPSGLINVGGKQMKMSEALKPFIDRFSGDTFYNADFDFALKSGAELKQVAGLFSKQRLLETAKTVGLGQEAIPFKAGRAIGQFIEHAQKATAYMTALGQGKTIQESLELATRAGFDYRQLTAFESQIMRRIIPFYSFCVPDDSLILTNTGWKTCDDVKKGELVLTYNIKKNFYEWQPAKEIHIFDYDSSLMEISNDRNTVRFTPDHRWVIETLPQTTKHDYGIYNYQGERKVKRGYELNTQDRIKVVSEFTDNSKSILSVEESELLGWLLTDGTWRWKGNYCEAVIYQSPRKSTYNEAVRVSGCVPKWFHPQNGVARLPVKKEKIEKIRHLLKRTKSKDNWADVVCGLSREAMDAMYNAMYMADGTIAKRTCDSFACQLDGVATTFEILATLLGKRVKRGERGYYVSEKQHLKIAGMNKKLVEYQGRVWCPKTENETWVMKQNGFITITGNTRKNIELQLKTLGENPQRINQVLSFFENIGETISPEEKEKLPSFIRESIGVKLEDAPNGMKQYISSFGTPIEAFTQLFGSNPILRTISQTNPLLKVPVEIGIGKDSFRQRDLKEVYDAKEYKLAPQIIKDILGIKPVQKPILEKNKQGKLVKVGERTEYIADPIKLLVARSLFTSRGVSYLDQVFGGDLQGFTKLLKTTTGLKPYQVDLEMQGAIQTSQQKRALEDLLTKYGVTKQFSRTYIPKK